MRREAEADAAIPWQDKWRAAGRQLLRNMAWTTAMMLLIVGLMHVMARLPGRPEAEALQQRIAELAARRDAASGVSGGLGVSGLGGAGGLPSLEAPDFGDEYGDEDAGEL
jgi:hypothetical protein